MTAALLMLVYALAVSWCLPPLLARLTATGTSARLGLAAWLIALASVLGCVVAAVQFLVRAAIAGWPLLAEAICRSVAGHACAPVVYRSAIFEIPLAAAALSAALTSGVLAWRYGRRVQQAQRRMHAHAEAARITGHRMPSASGTVVLDVPHPAAYCVPGRPATIVLTTGALALLGPEQLTAVIAHEKAHLAGGHHLLVTLTRGLSAVFPGVPLFSIGPGEVARLAEMRADDAAARLSGRPALVAALLAMGTGAAVPALALGATGCDVAARVLRLLEPAPRGRHLRNRLALITVILLLTVTAGLLARFSDPLAAHVWKLVP
jgi:Zn-dependent protease with chaperone function